MRSGASDGWVTAMSQNSVLTDPPVVDVSSTTRTRGTGGRIDLGGTNWSSVLMRQR